MAPRIRCPGTCESGPCSPPTRPRQVKKWRLRRPRFRSAHSHRLLSANEQRTQADSLDDPSTRTAVRTNCVTRRPRPRRPSAHHLPPGSILCLIRRLLHGQEADDADGPQHLAFEGPDARPAFVPIHPR
jgi:hypothetical protein